MGDETFHNFFDFTFRGILFSTFVISLWMFALYLLDYIVENFNVKKNIGGFIGFLLCYGYFFSMASNFGYRFVDTQYLHTDWGEIGYFNPTFTIGLTIIFLCNVGISEYFKSSIVAKENEILAEKLKKENAIANYKLLKAQIEPHFLFNSLSVLSSLIHQNPNLAEEFVVKLSKLLRFAIEQTDRVSVTLSEELKFTENYFFLLQTRFGNALQLKNEIDLNLEDYILPPYSLQLLIENAIQHNKFSEEKPLNIKIYVDQNFIWVENNLNIRLKKEYSTKVGLKILSQRIHHLSGKSISFSQDENLFFVKIPLIEKEITL